MIPIQICGKDGLNLSSKKSISNRSNRSARSISRLSDKRLNSNIFNNSNSISNKNKNKMKTMQICQNILNSNFIQETN